MSDELRVHVERFAASINWAHVGLDAGVDLLVEDEGAGGSKVFPALITSGITRRDYSYR